MSKRNAKAKPWERCKGESDRAYAAFLEYRDQGPIRSIESMGGSRGETGGYPRSTLFGWSSRHEWVERCRAWDNHIQGERDRVMAAEARKWERRRIDALEAAYNDVQALRKKARRMLDFPLSTQTVESKDGKTITTVKPARWTMGQAAMMLKLAAEIEAAVMAATAKDVTEMSDAELRGIEEALEVLGVRDEDAA